MINIDNFFTNDIQEYSTHRVNNLTEKLLAIVGICKLQHNGMIDIKEEDILDVSILI